MQRVLSGEGEGQNNLERFGRVVARVEPIACDEVAQQSYWLSVDCSSGKPVRMPYFGPAYEGFVKQVVEAICEAEIP